MKTIGLIGGISWLSTIEYYKLLNQMVNEKLGGVEAAKVIIYSVNFGEIKKLTEADEWESIAALICHAARQLENAGADCLLIGANTMHKIAGEVQAAVSIPVIHIAVETAKAVQRRQIRKVALLGTKYVMQLPFYKEKLAAAGIDIIIPGEEDVAFINNAIYTEMGKGLFLPHTKERMLNIITNLASEGAEAAILGCTEIPLLINQQESSIPLFDTTMIHATAAVSFALDLPV